MMISADSLLTEIFRYQVFCRIHGISKPNSYFLQQSYAKLVPFRVPKKLLFERKGLLRIATKSRCGCFEVIWAQAPPASSPPVDGLVCRSDLENIKRCALSYAH